MKIVVVDDSMPFRTAMGALLEDAGYQDVQLLSSGGELLQWLEQGDSDGAALRGIDLILMDVMMPQLDGIGTLQALKNHPRHQDIPVLIVSGQDEDSLIEAAFEAGAVDYVSKPVKKMELRARIRAALRLKGEMDRRKAREGDLIVLNSYLEGANDELRRLSCTDSLTRVANRRYFEESLKREWNRAKRTTQPLSVIMIDVDHFKEYNDTFGHVAGDRCLLQIAEALVSLVLRSSDLFARYGGEEFVALLAGTNLEGAASLAEAMRVEVEKLTVPHAPHISSPWVTISAGVATVIPNAKTSSKSLIEKADKALYDAKRGGRNCVRSGQ